MNSPRDAVDVVREAVAKRKGIDPSDLPPLADFVTRDALRALAGPQADLDAAVQVEYLWYTVTVHPDGGLDVTA